MACRAGWARALLSPHCHTLAPQPHGAGSNTSYPSSPPSSFSACSHARRAPVLLFLQPDGARTPLQTQSAHTHTLREREWVACVFSCSALCKVACERELAHHTERRAMQAERIKAGVFSQAVSLVQRRELAQTPSHECALARQAAAGFDDQQHKEQRAHQRRRCPNLMCLLAAPLQNRHSLAANCGLAVLRNEFSLVAGA